MAYALRCEAKHVTGLCDSSDVSFFEARNILRACGRRSKHVSFSSGALSLGMAADSLGAEQPKKRITAALGKCAQIHSWNGELRS